VTGYSFHNDWDLDSFNLEDIRQGYEAVCYDIEHKSQPLDEMEMVKLFTRAWIKTAGRGEDQISLDMALDIYCDDLMAFKGEIVRKVLHDWPDKNKWRPLWKSLVDEINCQDNRHKLKSAFRTMLNKLGIPFSELD